MRRRLALSLVLGLLAGLAYGQTVSNLKFPSGNVRFSVSTLRLPEDKLRFPVEDLAKPVKKTKTEERYRLFGDVLFDFDKATIRPEAEPALAGLARRIKAGFPGAPVRVEGHTDAKGSDSYNQRLSVERAESVKRWFAEKGGLGNAAITTRGFGESQPVAPNEQPDGSDNPEGRQQNRRVEIVVEKRG